jgi:hypothetical protein
MIIPNFLGGVSQQPDDLRLPNQVKEAINLNLSPVGGAAKRWPTQHIEEIENVELADRMIHPIDRDGVTYFAVIGDEDVQVWDSEGTPYLVLDTTAVAPYVADFTYLENTGRVNLRAQQIVDTTFVVNNLKTVLGAEGAARASWEDESEAGVFIKQTNYGVKYTVRVETDAPLDTEVSYTIPNAVELVALGVGTFTAAATANQAAGIDPFTLSFDANMIGELLIEVNGTPVVDPSINWSYDPVSRELFRTGAGLNPADTVDVGRIATDLNFPLRTDVIARLLSERLDALTGINVEYNNDDSSFRVYSADVIERFEVTDSVGGTYSSGWLDTVKSIVDLPTVFKHGAIIRVGGNESETADDYYVRFAGDEWSAAGRDYDDFDNYSNFGPGRWEEYTLPVEGEGSFDATTMPHVLVRTEDDGLGTYTGSPGEIFFDWRPYGEWNIREAGDSESNPVPSFVGFPLNDIFFWQGRLGLLADAYVVMSEAGNVSNFWRTTVQALPESDVIDIASTEDEGSVLLHAVPLDTRLYLFSKQSQIAIIGDPVLSPQSVEAPVVSKFLTAEDTQPTLVGRSLFFGFKGAQYQGFREFIPGEQALQFGDIEITAAAPKYIPVGEGRLLGSTVNNSLIFHTSEDPSRLWVYQYFRAGSELLQSAWSHWEVSGEIVDFCIVDEVVYLLTLHGSYTSLEKLSLGEGQVDPDVDFVTRLDRRIDDSQVSVSAYDIPNDVTAFLLPYEMDADSGFEVVTQDDGSNLNVSDIDYATSVIEVRGDHTATPLWLGIPYTAEMTLNRPTDAAAVGQGFAPMRSGETVVDYLHLIVDNTGFLEAEVTYRGGNDWNYPFPGAGVAVFDAGLEDSTFDDDTPTKDRAYTIPIHAKPQDFRVRLFNNSPLPSALVSGEWDIARSRSRSRS